MDCMQWLVQPNGYAIQFVLATTDGFGIGCGDGEPLPCLPFDSLQYSTSIDCPVVTDS